MAQQNSKNLRVLLVGAIPRIDKPSSFGGTSALFHHLLADLSGRPDVQTTVVDLERIQRPGVRRWLSCLEILLKILRLSPRCDVLSIHTGSTSLHLSGPPLALIAWALRKPLIIRQGAGTHYNELSTWKGALIRWSAMCAAFYLLETKRLVELAKSDGLEHARWFPNNRPLSTGAVEKVHPSRKQARRFVFISRITRTKGILEILEASRHLPPGVTVDVYGPFEEDLGPHIFAGRPSVAYKGLLPPNRVLEHLAEYDVLLLPTYYPREGYPGIIIEAFAVGLPVICTRWLCLDELVDERCGVLVTARNSSSLLEAMRRILSEPTLFQALQRGARQRAEEFSSAVWTERFLGYCREALMNRNRT